MTGTTTGSFRVPDQILLGGEWLGSASGGTLEAVNPSTGRVTGSVPVAGGREVDAAVEAAHRAFPQWRDTPPAERRRILFRAAELVRSQVDELAWLTTVETGVPISQTPWMVQYGIDWLEESAGWPEKLYGEVAPSGPGLTYTLNEPFGVVGIITTWNGSAGGFAMSVAPALATGCCVIVKPSELAPFGALKMAALLEEAGLPAGVLSVLTGGSDTGELLVQHPGVAKIAFTGGGRAASAIAASCAALLKPCVLELGGKSASVIFDDADIGRAITSAMSLTFNAGQTCTVGTRFVVQAGVYQQFVDQLAGAMASIPVGDPFALDTVMGPLITARSLERTLAMVEQARSENGTVVTGGSAVTGGPGGFYMQPTLVADVSNSSELGRNEVFGPVGAAMKFDTEEEAVALANDSVYGLAGYVHTSDASKAIRVAQRLDVGSVGVNGGSAPASPSMPFGGRKQSGYGRQGGLAGILEYVNVKTVNIAL